MLGYDTLQSPMEMGNYDFSNCNLCSPRYYLSYNCTETIQAIVTWKR